MKKLILLSFSILFIGCAALVDIEGYEEDKKRAEMRKERARIENFDKIRFPHKIIEFPDLSTEEIYKNSYFWLEMKFSNYDTNNFVETRMDDKIKIEYKSDFALEIPNKIKISRLIIVIDIKRKTIKIGMINPSNWSKPVVGGVSSRNNESKMMSSAFDEEKFEQEFELIQNYGDFINNNID